MGEILVMATGIMGLVLGFVELVKITFNVNERYLPLASIITGTVFGGLAFFMDIELTIRLWAGAIAGLSASGLFDGIKSTTKEGN